MKESITGVGIVVGLLVIIIGAFVLFSGMSDDKYKTLSTRDIAMLCTTDMATQFHIHPRLQIVVNGVDQVVPANTGITAGCMHSLHTHDTSGTLHVESPVARDFTLGDFFAVWDKTFTKDQILDSKVDVSHAITMTVNGTPVDSYENLVLKDLDQIVITYGSAGS